MPVSSKVIESLTRSIVEAVHPLKIILFGSHAQGKAEKKTPREMWG